jgi:gluconolactonase
VVSLSAEGLRFPEGPVALPDGSVLVCEIRSGTIARVDRDGSVERIAEPGGGPNGAALGPDGRLYVCQNGGSLWNESPDGLVHPGRALGRGGSAPPEYAGGSIQVVDLATGAVEVLFKDCDGNRLSAPNDLVFDPGGGFYFTDMGKRRDRFSDNGGLYYAHADGSAISELAYPLLTPNGVGLSPAGDRVYVAETITGRVWQWEIDGPGRLKQGVGPGVGGAALLYTFGGYELLDSLAIEELGNICVAIVNRGGIAVLSPLGAFIEFVEVNRDDPIVTNICFGGKSLANAYVTSSGRGRLYEAPWPRHGLELQHARHAPGSPDGVASRERGR